MKFLFHCSQILREPKNCKKGTQTQRGPNYERKGDQKGTFFDVKGDPKFDFFQNCSQRANMLKWSRNRINFFLEMFDFHMQNHIMGSRTLLLFYVKWSTNDTGSYYFAFYSLK